MFIIHFATKKEFNQNSKYSLNKEGVMYADLQSKGAVFHHLRACL